jgi:endonuclease/exonuclease/phosphatase family metal-dependent hydrolase
MAALVLAALVVPAPVWPETIRVVTYNIRMAKGQVELATPKIDIPLPFGRHLRVPAVPLPVQRPGQIDRIADSMKALKPDVVCFQEIGDRSLQSFGTDPAAALGKRLNMKYAFFVAHPESGGVLKQQGNAVYSRHPILEKRSVELSRKKGSMERRIAVFARLALPGHPEGVWVASLHAEVQSEEVRVASVERLAAAMRTMRGPILLTGDFNCGPAAPSIRQLFAQSARIGRPLVDAFAAAGQGPGGTSGAPAGNARIDYVFATPEYTPVRAWSPRDINDSDHFAVVADLASGAPAPDARAGSASHLLGVGAQ